MNDIDEKHLVNHVLAIGVIKGMYAGAGIVIVLTVCGGVIPMIWRWSSSLGSSPVIANLDSDPKPQAPFQAATVYKDVPFIGLSEAAIDDLNIPTTRRIIELDMRGREYFDAVFLKGRTRYMPRLLDARNVRSAITLNDGYVKRIVVQLVRDDGSPGRYGLIPLDEYENDLRNLGR